MSYDVTTNTPPRLPAEDIFVLMSGRLPYSPARAIQVANKIAEDGGYQRSRVVWFDYFDSTNDDHAKWNKDSDQ